MFDRAQLGEISLVCVCNAKIRPFLWWWRDGADSFLVRPRVLVSLKMNSKKMNWLEFMKIMKPMIAWLQGANDLIIRLAIKNVWKKSPAYTLHCSGHLIDLLKEISSHREPLAAQQARCTAEPKCLCNALREIDAVSVQRTCMQLPLLQCAGPIAPSGITRVRTPVSNFE